MSDNKVTRKNAKHGCAPSFKDEISHDAVCSMQVRHSDIEQMPLSTRGGNIYYSEGGMLGLYYCNHSVQVAGGLFCNNVQVYLIYVLALYPVCTSCSNIGAVFLLKQSSSLNNIMGVVHS